MSFRQIFFSRGEKSFSETIASGHMTMTPSNIPHIGHHLGLKIRQRRKQLGLSQRQVADSIGVTYQQVQKYERGVDRIPSDRLYGIARTLAADVGYFFEGLGEADTARPIGQAGRSALPQPGRLGSGPPRRRSAETPIQVTARGAARPGIFLGGRALRRSARTLGSPSP
jgi:transcriptional regulator with XRE-family HTH domain